jgi:hypothetical protein
MNFGFGKTRILHLISLFPTVGHYIPHFLCKKQVCDVLKKLLPYTNVVKLEMDETPFAFV